MNMEIINGNRYLEKKYPMIHGVGCFMPKKRMDAPQVIDILQRDLSLARSLSYKENGTKYFKKKAIMIEETLDGFLKTKNGHTYRVGYEPGSKFIYPGLPVEFAMHVDAAISETIEMISQCRSVAFVGFNCAGHPSGLLQNPVFDDYLENPSRILAQYGIAYSNEFLYSENRNPYFIFLLKKDRDSEMIKQELLKIKAEEIHKNATVQIRAREGFSEQHSLYGNLMFVSITGLPELFINGNAAEFNDVVTAYKKNFAKILVQGAKNFRAVWR